MSPWHEGELILQRSIGMEEALSDIGAKVVRTYLTEQHRDFFPLLPFAVLGTVDGAGDVWATVRAGRPGFLSSPDPLRLDLAIRPEPWDPAEAGIQDGHQIGLLGIDLTTRRRNRLNGPVANRTPRGFSIGVGQSFGNCPKYITLRSTAEPADESVEPPQILDGLDDAARRLIAEAKTFFVASQAAGAVDVSHRGGEPGFVRIDAAGTLTIPDYSGNRYFNTLGNLLVNPRAGLVFIDFATGDLLQMSGDAKVEIDAPDLADLPGAERLWRFYPRHIVRRPGGLPLRWR